MVARRSQGLGDVGSCDHLPSAMLKSRDHVVEPRLRPLNALIGLVTRGDVNPSTLADVGFRLVGLEVPIAGSRGTVTVDAILLHEPSAHLLLCEVKSGANADEDQAVRYAAADPHAVVQAGHVTLPRRVAPTTEVVYVCLGEHLSRIQQGFQAAAVRFPIVAVHGDKITLETVGNMSDHLRAPFAAGPILLQCPPIRFIAFDQYSPLEVIIPFIKSELITALANRIPQVTIAGLAERTAPYYGLYGRRAQGQLRKRVGEAAREIAKANSANFAYDPPTSNRDGLVRLLKTPEDNDTRGRTQAYQALARRDHTYRRRPRRLDPNQLDLLQELDQAEETADEEETQDEED